MATAAVVGGVSWNLLVSVPELPTATSSTLFSTGHREEVGSTGAGKALNLARLGFRTRLHALLGDDAPGRAARDALVAGGVELTSWTDPAGTERHLNLMDPHGDRLSIFLDRASTAPAVTADELVRFCTGADVVFVNLSEYARCALRPLRDHGVPVWVDLHDWDGQNDFHSDFVEHASHLFLSDVRLDDAVSLARRLVPGKEVVVVTHGSAGATAVLPGHEPLFVPPEPVSRLVDSNGAGDAFTAGVAFGRVRGWDWPASLRAGAVAGARCVESPGLAAPTITPELLLRF